VATTFEDTGALAAAVGAELGPTEWRTITQAMIDGFAAATGDHQWIHVDVERAKAGPFGAPIAHGYLTLALCAPFLAELVAVEGISMGINYGVNKARFITPVRAGSRVRARGTLQQVDDVPGGVQAVVAITIEIEGMGEIEGEAKPAAVVETVSRYLDAPS
jgi:acyl dehydratase